MKFVFFVFFSVSENGENGLNDEGADWAMPHPQNFWARTAPGKVFINRASTYICLICVQESKFRETGVLTPEEVSVLLM